MGIIKSIGNLLTGSATSRDIFDRKNGHLKNFGEWIGNMKFTQEEMAELDAEVAQGIRKFAVDTMSENTDRSRARRELAIFIVKFYALILFIAGMTYKLDAAWSAFWLKIAVDSELGWLVLGVGAFFWGVHTLRASKE